MQEAVWNSSVERSRHLGRTIEAAHRYDLIKEEFEAL